jgi:cytoskeleton protein RodZ
MTELPGEGAVAASTPGARLASARAAAGLTAEDVAAQMRISLRQVQAIEADRYDELPGAVFVRGFVKNYARLLQLDPTPLLHALEPALGGDVPLRAQEYAGALPESARRGHMRLWLILFVVAVVVVLGAAGYEFWRSRSIAMSPAELTPPQADKSVESPQAPHTATEPIPLTPERIVDAPASGAAADAVSAAGGVGSVASTPSPPVVPSGPASVEVTFVQDSWLEVRDGSGKLLFSGTGRANTSQAVTGEPPLDLLVGNAIGVRIAYNQRPVDVMAHASRNIARLTLE